MYKKIIHFYEIGVDTRESITYNTIKKRVSKKKQNNNMKLA